MSLLCFFGIHDWEVVDRKGISKINHQAFCAVYNEPMDSFKQYPRECCIFYKKVCLSCGKISDAITPAYNRAVKEYKQVKSRQDKAKELLKQLEGKNAAIA